MKKKQQPMPPPSGDKSLRRGSIISLSETSQSRVPSSAHGKSASANQHAAIRGINAYLHSHNFHVFLSPKSLPSAKDVRDIITFLVRQLDPGWELGKLEEDVPFMLKSHGYPGQLTKSSFVAVGSPHTWPVLLAALWWLVQLLSYQERVAAQDRVSAQENNDGIMFDFIARSYEKFITGLDDDEEALRLEFMSSLENEKSLYAQRALEIEAENKELEAKLKNMETGTSVVENLARRKADFVNDIKKFENLVEGFGAKKASFEKSIGDKEKELQIIHEEIQSVGKEIEDLKATVDCQKVNVRDFEKMNREAQGLDAEIQSAEVLRKEREDRAWELEVAASKKLKELKAAVESYSQEIARLKLGASFEYKLNSEGTTPSEILGVDTKSLKSEILASTEDFDKKHRVGWEESIAVQQKLHEKICEQERKRELNSGLLAGIKKLEYQCELTKKTMEEYTLSKATQGQKLLSEVERKKEELSEKEIEAESLLKKSRDELEEITKRYDDEIQACSSDLLQLIEASLKQKEQAGRAIASAKTALKETIQETKSIIGGGTFFNADSST